VEADEGPTPFTVTGDSFINSVSNQFTSINGMRRFHQSKTASLPQHKYQILHQDCEMELDQTGT
jgi:hypothetical protein